MTKQPTAYAEIDEGILSELEVYVAEYPSWLGLLFTDRITLDGAVAKFKAFLDGRNAAYLTRYVNDSVLVALVPFMPRPCSVTKGELHYATQAALRRAVPPQDRESSFICSESDKTEGDVGASRKHTDSGQVPPHHADDGQAPSDGDAPLHETSHAALRQEVHLAQGTFNIVNEGKELSNGGSKCLDERLRQMGFLASVSVDEIGEQLKRCLLADVAECKIRAKKNNRARTTKKLAAFSDASRQMVRQGRYVEGLIKRDFQYQEQWKQLDWSLLMSFGENPDVRAWSWEKRLQPDLKPFTALIPTKCSVRGPRGPRVWSLSTTFSKSATRISSALSCDD